MRGTSRSIAPRAAFACAAALVIAALAGCGAVDRVRGTTTSTSVGATSDKEARYVSPENPLARPIQVGWTSARASHCGFVFNPDQLRADFLASEARAGIPPDIMPKIEHAYDYTRQSVAELDQGRHQLLQQGSDSGDQARPQPLSGRRLRADRTHGAIGSRHYGLALTVGGSVSGGCAADAAPAASPASRVASGKGSDLIVPACRIMSASSASPARR